MASAPKATSLFPLHSKKPVSQAKVGKCFRSMLKEHRSVLVKEKCAEALSRVRLKVLIASPVIQTEANEQEDLSEDEKRESIQPSKYQSLKRFPLILSKLLVPTSSSTQHHRSRSAQRPKTALGTRHVSARRGRGSVVSVDKEINWIREMGKPIWSGGMCPDIVKEVLSHGYVKHYSPKARSKSPARWEASPDLHISLYRRKRTYRKSASHLE